MNDELKFEEFAKISRLKRDCTITEKIDGTNAQLLFDADGNMLTGSRKREIFPEGTEGKPKGCDNYGFSRWARDNRDELFAFLGEGRHFGELCGGSIQRGYGTTKRHFMLFNTSRFNSCDIPPSLIEAGLGVVPVLFLGVFTTDAVDATMNALQVNGSHFMPGFMNPEGVVIYHHALRSYFKVTYEHDGTGKGTRKGDS